MLPRGLIEVITTNAYSILAKNIYMYIFLSLYLAVVKFCRLIQNVKFILCNCFIIVILERVVKKKVIIIGAGISGLYLASLLEKEFEVTILEARSRIGGRIFSIDEHDLGPSWIWQHHKEMLALVQRLGLSLFAQYTQGDALYDTVPVPERFTSPPSAPSARMQGSLSMLVDSLKNALVSTIIELEQEVIQIEQADERLHVRTQTNSFYADFAIVTLPPRLSAGLMYEPPLPRDLLSLMLSTPTWMGQSAKCVIEFRTPFWKEQGLSGFAFSNIGPMGEIHDASHKNVPALFGFIHTRANWQNLREDIIKQLVRLFDIKEDEIVRIEAIDWKKERFTSDILDAKPLSTHPEYGIDTTDFSDKILFSATEFSFSEGGYLEGALRRANLIAAELLKLHESV